jgi:hypothetical protein
MNRLSWLDLAQTNVSDAGLVSLKGLNNLVRLELQKTSITDAGVNDLRKALPNCQIDH